MYNINTKPHLKNRFFLKMKCTILFLVLGINISFALDTYSQTTRLSLRLKDKSLKDVFTR